MCKIAFLFQRFECSFPLPGTFLLRKGLLDLDFLLMSQDICFACPTAFESCYSLKQLNVVMPRLEGQGSALRSHPSSLTVQLPQIPQKRYPLHQSGVPGGDGTASRAGGADGCWRHPRCRHCSGGYARAISRTFSRSSSSVMAFTVS